ncbi:hypothetical protein HDU92_004160 [Lobulomyces angularis]|nr:hypothetical protein HDU92_004160 [Lobulomyces angularis]
MENWDTQKPRTLGVVLYEGFAVLDVFGPVQFLNVLSNKFPLKVVFISENGKDVSTKPPIPHPNSIFPQSYQVVKTDYSFETCPHLDILFVPGGSGVKLELQNKKMLNFLIEKTKIADLVITICNGSALYAKTGCLDGVKATSNKAIFALAEENGPAVNWVKEARFVYDKKFLTSSGVAAGMDATCYFIKVCYGEEEMRNLSMIIEYKPQEDGSQDEFAKLHKLARIEDYILGNCIGKGAFGSVYSGLNERTGETVAIKQINLLNIPKCEVDLIMMEIGLLKGLNHPNIVKYKGFIKTQENLNIIMEFCENGSLFHLRKKFGGFKENLVSNFVHKILLGLIYLHEQGILHRDLKCGNILTTKVAEVKLADFGVAAKLCDVQIDNVAGSPYWMAPEVIELNGATTASDIWSLGCTILEMIVGNPPYHTLAPMSALFRMVQDDHPPIPEYLSPLLRDFLLECFQKDPYLRISAKNLIKHPWIKSINGQPKSSSKVSEVSEVIGVKESWDEDFQENELEAKSMLLKNVKSLAEAEKMSSNWDEDFDVTNEKEFSFENCQKKKKDLPFHENEVFTRNEKLLGKELSKYNELAENQKLQLTNNSGLKGTPKKNFGYILPETELENNWDNDFEVEETHSNLVSAKQLTNLYDSEIKLNTFSAVEENLDNVHIFLDEENGNDWSDIFNFNVTLEKNRNNFKCPDSFEEDPFSNLEDNDENLENDANTNNWYISKSFEYDLKEKLNNKFDVLINNKTLSDQELIKICEYLGKTFLDNPIQKSIILKSHYLMPLLELLERQTKEFVILKLLKFLNQCIEDSVEILESFCLFGGIPIMLKFCKKYYSIDIRIESSIFIKYLCKNVEILKIFISCNGLKSFSEFFDEENFDINKKVLVENAADSIISVLNIQVFTYH